MTRHVSTASAEVWPILRRHCHGSHNMSISRATRPIWTERLSTTGWARDRPTGACLSLGTEALTRFRDWRMVSSTRRMREIYKTEEYPGQNYGESLRTRRRSSRRG